ncbi:flagellar basal body protein [Legionella fallonii]|nr:flagellar basal body protein [Legionella fallonii]
MNSDSTIELVSLALDAALMRQTAIANNIANANTTNYQTLEVNFEQQIQDLPLNLNQQELDSVHPHYQVSEHQSTIDEQMVLNVQNMTHYRALIKGLNQKLAIMKLALQGTNQ